jgi:S-adenosylmethionine synthetase
MSGGYHPWSKFNAHRWSNLNARRHFDLTPRGIVDSLKLCRPIYRSTAAYGHFGRALPEFTWERTDRAQVLRDALVVG